MTHSKINYLSSKINTQTKNLSDRTKMKRIRDEIGYYLKSDATINTPLGEAVKIAQKPDTDFNKVAYDKEAKALKNKANMIKDEIMLGDETKALKLIIEFCQKS